MADDFILSTDSLSRRFGGLSAVADVSIDIVRGSVHAILGPNGAGKTTLINLLSGNIRPSAGTIRFKGADITGLPAHRVARLGIGRSYQKTNIFRDFTCFENCFLAAQSRLPSALRFFRPALRYAPEVARAERALALCGLARRRDTVATQMSYGEQRQLELGMMLATEPELLLLDEPLAGMGREESARVVDLLKALARDHTLVMIEHDMDAVFAIAETITVMVDGRVLETGPADAVRASPAVRAAYLGDGG
ncbi:MAG: ABC transporter ATP-binding protein [Alphaproteobacteria bacterium]|nr:ABC transporter ATP-binding protein [Alphaproteobacteria bacterium]